MTREIELTQGYKAIVDDEKYEWLTGFKWHVAIRGKKTKVYYAASTETKFRGFMHNLLLPCPKGYMPDHVDGNGLNNQMSNLRIATRIQNAVNKPPYAGRFKGVYKTGDKWRARIEKNIHLGYFFTPEDAARAYDAKAKELWGEFAWLNFK